LTRSARYAKELAEVEAAFRRLPRAKKSERWMAKNYVGAGESELEFLDLTASTLDARLKKGFSFSERPIADQWRIWDFIFRASPTFEVITAAFAFADTHRGPELAARRKLLERWVERSDNWATSDGLSSLYARILEHDRAALLSTLSKWAGSKNPWKRRQSLVSLLYYSRGRDPQRVLPYARLIAFVELQIADPHYYVQKGVGWTIREIYNVYPRETTAWLTKNITRVAAPAWQAATEKLPPATKSELKALRKEASRGRKKK
jgi:3-methyladenine DNA glycosylase AlkD